MKAGSLKLGRPNNSALGEGFMANGLVVAAYASNHMARQEARQTQGSGLFFDNYSLFWELTRVP
jgi:hypothetical protein